MIQPPLLECPVCVISAVLLFVLNYVLVSSTNKSYLFIWKNASWKLRELIISSYHISVTSVKGFRRSSDYILSGRGWSWQEGFSITRRSKIGLTWSWLCRSRTQSKIRCWGNLNKYLSLNSKDVKCFIFYFFFIFRTLASTDKVNTYQNICSLVLIHI